MCIVMDVNNEHTIDQEYEFYKLQKFSWNSQSFHEM